MTNDSNTPKRFALIGKHIAHSFSPAYFESFFAEQGLTHSYSLLEVNSIEELSKEKLLEYDGLNVTLPFKQSIIPLLDELSEEAKEIGAVNCIAIQNNRLIGHNTDVYGFKISLRPFLKSHHSKALILGSGGASKAVSYVLDELGIEYFKVSRAPSEGQFHYDDLNAKAVEFFPFIINTTPLGAQPFIDSFPSLPYDSMGNLNFLYDLIYNPDETEFLKKGKNQGAQTQNGMSMLIKQAEKSWEIWNS